MSPGWAAASVAASIDVQELSVPILQPAPQIKRSQKQDCGDNTDTVPQLLHDDDDGGAVATLGGPDAHEVHDAHASQPDCGLPLPSFVCAARSKVTQPSQSPEYVPDGLEALCEAHPIVVLKRCC